MGNVGNTSLYQTLSDQYGDTSRLTQMGEFLVVEPVRLLGTTFTGSTLDANFWNTVATGSGSAYVSNGEAILSTGATANSTVSVQSVQTSRYVGGSSARYRAVRRFYDTGVSNNVRRWGTFSTTDGCFFELNGTNLYAVTRIESTDTKVLSSAWNGRAFSLDTNVHTWEIFYTNKVVIFSVDGNMSHRFTATTSSWSATLNLPIRVENNNSGGLAQDVLTSSRTTTIYRLGRLETETVWYHSTGAETKVLKSGPGKLHSLVVGNPGGTTDTCTIYDNTAASGSVISIVGMGKYAAPVTLPYNTGLSFNNGLTIVTTGTSDLTIIYE